MMSRNHQIANILAFLCIFFGEDSDFWTRIMDFNPDYIIDKFGRYVESCRIEHPWGLHPCLRSATFNRYINKWKLDLEEEE